MQREDTILTTIKPTDSFKLYYCLYDGENGPSTSRPIYCSLRSMEGYLLRLFSGKLPEMNRNIVSLDVFVEMPFGHPQTREVVEKLRASLRKKKIKLVIRDVNSQDGDGRYDPNKRPRFTLTLGKRPDPEFERLSALLALNPPRISMREDRVHHIKNHGVWN